MLDSAVRALLLAISATLAAAEPAAEEGGGAIRLRGAAACIDAHTEQTTAPQSPEPLPAAGIPSRSPTADRSWLIRAAVTSQGVEVVEVAPGFVVVRVLR
jgi:hypothetical protein